MANAITVDQLVEVVGMSCEVIGDPARFVSRPAPIDAATADAVTFYSRDIEAAGRWIRASGAGVVICTPEAASGLDGLTAKTLLLVACPRLAFIRVMNRLFSPPRPVGIHPTAVIHPGAAIGEGVHIGAFTCVGKSLIGDRTVIEGHTCIYDNVQIGKDCTVQAGAIIGASGFSLERNRSGEFEEWTHIGGVRIGNNVLICSGVVIARGTVGDTRIGDGTKIDALTEISHNVVIGRHCGICASVVVAGSVRIGDRSWISFCSSLRNGVTVGAGATIGMGSVVTKDVPEGATVYGVPARVARSRR